MRYAVELTPDSNGTLLVTCPDLPEVTSFGVGEADALRHALDAVETAIQGRINARRPIPEPAARGEHYVALPASAVLKIALHQAMQEEGIRKADLGRLLGVHAPQIDRLLDLSHASRMGQIESALAALHRRVDVSVERMSQ
jgi:antitoxin HicB